MIRERTINGILVRQIPTLERYWISCDGLVWADPWVSPWNGTTRCNPGRWLKPVIRALGRKSVDVHRVSNKKESIVVARLVALAWIGPIPKDKPWVLHKDSDPSNDLYTNLYYGTPKENTQDFKEAGGFENWKDVVAQGEEQGLAQLTNAQAREIFIRVKAGEKQADLAREFNVSRPIVSMLVNRKTWRKITKDL